ncbi:T9SS type A sorting domain-containing protein [Hymenobacter sp. HSC-4F20]|uniref:T9SS type A sorting domain-containing protein n=1 Tax=Hymenobacter sp. HSC-4F20 TaxID=2864135 RepID=UPI001C72D5CB|nr:T9SS type A sorting domain-containing protein [Hymenobacter sp. HSC-4F20]MBX0291422.1 T9SS type A sorting domain-containing protein [Hymenobacter sp. HSC-4F20]
MRQYYTLRLLAALLSGVTLPASAQSSASFGFEYRDVAKVVHGTYTLRNPWAGGLNSPQFSNIDLNADQQPDLFVFDRAAGRVFTFLSVAEASGRAWQYAPEYEMLFPGGLQGWVLLRDYDCDGRPDLFTYANGGDIRVYRHVPDAQGRPGFQLVTNQLTYFEPGPLGGDINITAGGYNMPDIRDVDGDGRLDIVTYDFASSAPAVNYFRNSSTGACGGLQFVQGSYYWGGFAACLSACTSFVFAADQCRPLPRPQHTGGFNITLLDLDGDGDQDVLTGRDNCPELLSLRNDGTAQTALMTSAGLSTGFPAGTAAARVPNFPAAYLADVTFDGRPDVLVAPNLYDNVDSVETRQSVWLYRNAGSGTAPTLVREQTDFLQRDMLDVSETAAPAFGDIDGDGLVDMLVGGVSRNNATAAYRASLNYYRNTGTAAQPIFQLVSNDYLGLVSRKFIFLKPALVDLNQDGALDLVYSAARPGATASQGAVNALYYVLNTARPGQPAAFNPVAAGTLANMPTSLGDAPCFTDVDADGRVDMLLGTNYADVPFGALRYYRNVGAAALSQTFVLQEADFGQLRTSTGSRPSNLHPTVADFDGDGRPDLLTAEASGQIRFFSNYRALTGAFTARTDLFYNPLVGQFQAGRFGTAARFHYAPAAADVTGDGAPELFLGLEGGGIMSFGTRNRLVTAAQPTRETLPLQLYPNPAVATVTVEAPQPVRATVLDLTGRIVRPATPAARRHQLDIAGLAAGIYIVRCQAPSGETAVRRLEVIKGR